MQTNRLNSETHPQITLEVPADSDFMARYEILGEAGRGGMGIVYRARQKSLERVVAIKITLPEAPIERFLREARLLAKIKSPYVVTVHDFEVLPNGCPLLVMEWVEGIDLRSLILKQNEPLTESDVIPWMRHTCEGMLIAAEQGIIHRDLKPSNLLIDDHGCAKVADFGLARGPGSLSELSQVGCMMGTPYYMAPEQAEDPRGVDTRADIYSFGATFYHALTGKPPFQGETAFSILYKHKTEPLVSPRVRSPGLSERTSDLIERCLAKAPADRFSSFAELLKHLQPTTNVSSPWVVSEDRELAAYLERYQARKPSYLSERSSWNLDLDVYPFPWGQTIRIIRGDLVSQSVDALVNSDTCYLQMDFGVSLALRQAGGNEIFEELARQKPVRPGRAVVTTAGKLPARLIFHGVTVGFVEGQLVRASRDLIAEIIASCFYQADSYEVRSIAFPLLATGAQGFPRGTCLDAMFQCLARMFLRGLTSVREARIVLYRWPEEDTEPEAR
jgi:serine/threonine protein kinase